MVLERAMRCPLAWLMGQAFEAGWSALLWVGWGFSTPSLNVRFLKDQLTASVDFETLGLLALTVCSSAKAAIGAF